MLPHSVPLRRPTLWLLAATLLLTAGCSSAPIRTDDPDRAAADVPADSATLWQQYRAAVADAQTAEPAEISTALTPITPYASSLIRKDAPDPSAADLVRVAHWTNGFSSAVPGDTITARSPIWVTLVPDVRTFCESTGLTGQALHLRMAQHLGLPPNDPSARIVEFWVQPEDLARPCPDPEITDRECELEQPVPQSVVRVDSAHAAWMNATRRASYSGDIRYPWTRLGYTYDWHPDAPEVGTSEYILRTGGRAIIHDRASTDAYCSTP